MLNDIDIDLPPKLSIKYPIDVRPAGLETNISASLKVLGTRVHKGIHVTQTIPFTMDFW